MEILLFNAVKWQSSVASRFIGELPGEHLEKLPGGPLSGRGGWRDEMEEILHQAKKRAEAAPSPLFAQYEGQKFKPGQPVKHPTFGIGVIRRIDGDILHIIFKTVGGGRRC